MYTVFPVRPTVIRFGSTEPPKPADTPKPEEQSEPSQPSPSTQNLPADALKAQQIPQKKTDTSENRAKRLEELASKYWVNDRFTEAARLFNQAIQVRQEDAANNVLQLADNHLMLSQIYSSLKQPAKAEVAVREALALQESYYNDPMHPELIDTLAMLSSILSDEERFAETQPVMERVVEIAKAVYGPQDKETARRIGELGIIHHMQGPDHADDTEMQYISALKIMKKLIQQNELSPTDWDYLYLLSNLANLYAQIGKNVEAEATVKKVLEYKRMSPEKDTPRKVLPDLRLLAQIYQDQDKRDEAEGTYIEVLKIEEATFGKDSAELCPTLNNMGAFYCQQESWNTAEPLLKRAKALLLTEETPDLEGLMSTSRNLIGVYAHTNRPVEAEEEYNWLLGLCQRHNLPDPFAED